MVLNASQSYHVAVLEPGEEIWLPLDLWPKKPTLTFMPKGAGQVDFPVTKSIFIRNQGCNDDPDYIRSSKKLYKAETFSFNLLFAFRMCDGLFQACLEK